MHHPTTQLRQAFRDQDTQLITLAQKLFLPPKTQAIDKDHASEPH